MSRLGVLAGLMAALAAFPGLASTPSIIVNDGVSSKWISCTRIPIPCRGSPDASPAGVRAPLQRFL